MFGEGPVDAALMFVGEQPGDQEDLAGQARSSARPAGCSTARWPTRRRSWYGAYVTNAVKHFKFERRGKRRIHEKPDAGEITACRWWIDQERVLVSPR